MVATALGGTFRFAPHAVNRMGYGAMQLAGPGVFGPPKDLAAAVAVLPYFPTPISSSAWRTS